MATGFKVSAVIAAIVLVAALGWTVVTGSDSEKGGGFLGNLGGVAAHLHGGSHHHNPMAELIAELELRPDQQEHLNKIHAALQGRGHGKDGMQKLHDQLIGQFRSGALDAGEIRRVVDDHVEQMRAVGYTVTDELVVLVNGLDARQRQIVLEHFEGN